ncbi:MAG: hypothetical protein ACJAXJ_002050 [Colwellia sp.]|jgi:hypothetical protein
MAKHLKLETLMINSLETDFTSDKAEEFQARYFLAKSKLKAEIWDWIRSNEPDLSDHSTEHIVNVLDNAYKLLESGLRDNKGKNFKVSEYSGLEIYLLCMTILFHDVGNFFQRKYHNQTIQTILNDCFKEFFFGAFKREKQLIIKAGRAHTGKSDDGASDTLKDISNIEHCGGEKVRLQDIASIVRLADELAEGQQRTSSYMLKKNKFSLGSVLFHRYAECTHIMIDALNRRINIAYEIDLKLKDDEGISGVSRDNLEELLKLIHHRVYKLDQERKYCGYYCSLLTPINETQISFNFENHGLPLEYKIDPLTLNDLTVPGDDTKAITTGRDDLAIAVIIDNLTEVLTAQKSEPNTITVQKSEPNTMESKKEDKNDETKKTKFVGYIKSLLGRA